MKFFDKIVATLAGHKASGPFLPQERPGYGMNPEVLRKTEKLKTDAGRDSGDWMKKVRTFDREQQEKKALEAEEKIEEI